MIATVATWIFDTLTGDAALMDMLGEFPLRSVREASYAGVAERSQAFPCVVYGLQSGGALTEENDRCGFPTATRVLFQVKAVVRGEGIIAAEPFYARFNALLTGATATPTGYRFDVTREQVLSYTEVNGSDRYRHHGGVWAFTVREE